MRFRTWIYVAVSAVLLIILTFVAEFTGLKSIIDKTTGISYFYLYLGRRRTHFKQYALKKLITQSGKLSAIRDLCKPLKNMIENAKKK
jgi:hypothetical protein